MSDSSQKIKSTTIDHNLLNQSGFVNSNTAIASAFVSWRYRLAKRLFDIVGATFGILFLSPLFVAVYFSVLFSSNGNPIFVQQRWGQHGRLIKIFKFRTMYADRCDHSGVMQTTAHDNRVTKLGRILRRTNLDELPQLFNVLIGDLSLVGPRCHVPNMLAGGMLYESLVPNYHDRHAVKPGITGLAQVRGLRGPTTNPFLAKKRIAADLEYIRNRTFWLDVRIVVQTIVQELRRATGS